MSWSSSLRRARPGSHRRAPEPAAPPATAIPAGSVARTSAQVAFECNLCGAHNVVVRAELQRETPSCSGCGSTVRLRAMAHLLVTELLGLDAALPALPAHRELRGLGLSDDPRYADLLAQRFDYTNTWFDQEPRLDIASIPDAMEGRYDFLLASDVFEHVVTPVSRAFVNARRLLKPGGVLVLTAPFSLEDDTLEHFPELHDFRIGHADDEYVLHNRTRDGREQRFGELVFHGSSGGTLEMRIFSRAALERELAGAGFGHVRVANEPCARHGIVWGYPWSLPIVARP